MKLLEIFESVRAVLDDLDLNTLVVVAERDVAENGDVTLGIRVKNLDRFDLSEIEALDVSGVDEVTVIRRNDGEYVDIELRHNPSEASSNDA